MKRRGFMGQIAGSAVLGAAGVAAGQENQEAGALVTTPAVVMAPRPDGVEVVWAVSRLSRGRVEWKGDDGSTGTAAADRFGFVPQGDEILRVRLEGLAPGAGYQVRAITEAADGKSRHEGPWKKFRTLDPAGSATNFVIWNDTHQNEETIRKLHQLTPGGDFLLWNGDTCNDWHQEDWLVPTLLNPAGQDVSEGRPMLLVWGNHDVRGKWAYRVPEMVATPAGRPFYAFRSGPVAVICLHTGEDKPDDHPSFGGRVAFEGLRREQAAWMKEVIARPEFRDAPYRVVFCHIPLRWTKERKLETADYGNGNYDAFSRASRDAWHDVLVAWKTQVVISGHTHQPAWIPATDDFPYAQLVGGGPQPERATWIEGKAGATSLELVMKRLDGEIAERIEFKPLG
ncbi:metallophosphoesterase family protein [Luteolibacter marinus]|uniref:metallophosphoesterase family protein n=1 Tax=Luteolibacter marinus TaxID=2776705 RepID=UPI0018683E77|nr:metallophosphoesterase [Luteolibacter marinus]